MPTFSSALSPSSAPFLARLPRRIIKPDPVSARFFYNLHLPQSVNGLSALSPFPASIAQRRTSVSVRASSAVPEESGGGRLDDGSGGEALATKAPGELYRVVELGILFGLWYLFNIYFNIYNKQILKVFPFPFTISASQFIFGSLFSIFMWLTGLYKRPKISMSMLLAILPLAAVHSVGNFCTNISLGKVSVSFTHTVKAMEPFFTVVLSAMFVGEMPSFLVLSSLVPIVGGVALASLTEASFNWYGFWSAMGSNLSNQYRNVLSKKLMVNNEESLDNITMFSIITIMSLILSAPVAYIVEGIKFTPAYLHSMGLNVQDIYVRALLAAISFHAYQQISYMILAKVSPVTHSVANCVKRVVVIVASVIFFRTPVSLVNSLGTGVALVGVFLYSRAKRIKEKAA